MNNNIKPVKSMKFNNYVVNKISYQKNRDFKRESSRRNRIKINNNFKSTVYYSRNDLKSGIVNINVKIGDTMHEDVPFEVIVDVDGVFSFDIDADNFKQFEIENDLRNMLALNGNAILFPYIREIVSSITLKSNTFPSYVFPTLNFYKELNENDSIKFREISKPYVYGLSNPLNPDEKPYVKWDGKKVKFDLTHLNKDNGMVDIEISRQDDHRQRRIIKDCYDNNLIDDKKDINLNRIKNDLTLKIESTIKEMIGK
ncbi:hypothetical protein AKUH4B202J_09080 [Apilactobacillus kunkeei]|nr:hypothetical protein AKUH4B204J_09350 [Apilactobacillus kunkeei]CAI2617368.1 hypothetical protein AKUH4B202J_09080 [Apilactobacillus kunkeei]